MPNFLRSLFIAFLLNTVLEAKDFGVYGSTSSIDEDDFILFLQERLQQFSNEDREAFIHSMQTSALSQLKKTMTIEGLERARNYSVVYLDPSISVDRDILNHHNQVIVKKGTRYNPLSNFPLHQDLLFFDATDSEQLNWAQSLSPSFKWILTRGEPFQLEEKLNRPIYFDQGAVLIKKFGIKEIPARVSQEGLRLKIEFIPVSDKA